jgi:putative ABC transport system permease protein
MLKNYFKIAWRNLMKNKAFSIINIFGLAIGIAACFLIYLYVSYELSYDSYHDKGNRIYRLVSGNNNSDFSSASFAIGPALKREYPEIQSVARIWYRDFMIEKGKDKFQENNVMYADSSLFAVFSFSFVKGNSITALSEPATVVLSETAEKKYFGNADPIGQSLQMEGNQPGEGKYTAKVTGVIHDFPANSNFRADIIVSMVTLSKKLADDIDNNWESPIGHTYLLLPEGYNAAQLQSKFTAFTKKYADKIVLGDKNHFALSIEPLKNVYLHGKYPSQENGNIYNVYIFSVIAIFILLIACINFINLTTARSLERAKEVGVRKVIGSSRLQLIRQFLGESSIICFIASLFACLFCYLFLPVFNKLCGKIVSNGLFEHSATLLLLLAIVLLVGLIGGLYPAFVLSSFKPVLTLKKRFIAEKSGISLRQILVVSQFTISIILIICTIVVYLQLNYIRNQPLGFKKDQMLVIDFHHDQGVKENIEMVKKELSLIPNILSVSASSGIPNSGFEPADYKIENKSGAMEHAAIALYMVDEDFFNQYQIGLLAGRVFSKNFTTDFKDALVVNEAALKTFGYTKASEIIGKHFSGEGEGTVIGVVKNFNFSSLHQNIAPLIFRTFFLANRYITLNIASTNVLSTISALEARWKQLEPQRPLEYFFLDQAINKQYRSEENFGKLFLYFGVLAIFISCLGLLGLTLFSTFQRTKEIGIRKVLGASVTGIVYLLSGNFLKLVIIAFIIASPMAWIVMSKWLKGFAYHINISWWIFFAAGLLAIAIAFITVSFQSIKAAITNPVKSLKAE